MTSNIIFSGTGAGTETGIGTRTRTRTGTGTGIPRFKSTLIIPCLKIEYIISKFMQNRAMFITIRNLS